MKHFACVAILAFLTSFSGAAQDVEVDSSSFAKAVRSFLNADKLKIGLVGQAGVSMVDDGSNTESEFGLMDFRILFSGNISRRFSYYSQIRATNNKTVQLLDLRLTYSPMADLFIDVGKFKIPFSREYLRSLNELTFIRMSRVAEYMGLGRDLGLQGRVSILNRRVNGTLAIMNGESGDDVSYPTRSISVIATRLTVTPWNTLQELDGMRCEIGGSFVYADDIKDLTSLRKYWYAYKRLWSADMRFQYGRFWIESEGGWFLIPGGTLQVGWAASGGAFLSNELEMVARVDYSDFAADIFYRRSIEREYTFGINWFADYGIKCQANYVRDHTHSTNGVYFNFQYTVNRE